MALEAKKGIESVSPSVQVELYQVPETLSQEILDKMHAPPKPDIPIITGIGTLFKLIYFLNFLGFHNIYIYIYKITYIF